jgi:branched-chain amino acid transport system substrate-binding protein
VGRILTSAAEAQILATPLRIGVLGDMSGVYADDQGPGSVLAAQMAVEDYGAKAAGRTVEVVSARDADICRQDSAAAFQG